MNGNSTFFNEQLSVFVEGCLWIAFEFWCKPNSYQMIYFTATVFFNLLLNAVIQPKISNMESIIQELMLSVFIWFIWWDMFEISRTKYFLFSSSHPAEMHCMQVSVLQVFVIVTSFSVWRTAVTEIGPDRILGFCGEPSSCCLLPNSHISISYWACARQECV